jgi:hypothetical protein
MSEGPYRRNASKGGLGIAHPGCFVGSLFLWFAGDLADSCMDVWMHGGGGTIEPEKR